VGEETLRKRKKKGDVERDVVAHIADQPVEDDPERKRKRKRKQSDQPEGDELGKKRK
jgi:hypothetical protein